jgi:hypothetical protein
MKYFIAILISFLSLTSCASIHSHHSSHHVNTHHVTTHPHPSIPLHSRPKNYGPKYHQNSINESQVIKYGSRFYFPIFNHHTSKNDTIWGNSENEVVTEVNSTIEKEDTDGTTFILVMLFIFMIFALIMFKYRVFGK